MEAPSSLDLSLALSLLLFEKRSEAGVHGVSGSVAFEHVGSSCALCFYGGMNMTRKQGQHGLLTRVYTRLFSLFLYSNAPERGRGLVFTA